MGYETEKGLAPSRRFPLLVWGPAESPCHGARTLYVRSGDGGLVKRNCFSCNQPWSVSKYEFLKLDINIGCPRCAKPMTRTILPYQENHGFECSACEFRERFADVLPHYSELVR